MANNIDLTISALECPLGTFQCSGRLIFRLRTEPAFQAAPVFRSAYSASRNTRPSAAFAASIEAHCAFSSKTLMLQVRFAHPPNPAPSTRLFSISRRSGLMAPLCKGSCPASSRTEGLSPWGRGQGEGARSPLPQSPHRTSSSSCSGVSLGLFGKPKRSSFSRIRGLHQSTLCFFFQNAHASGSLRSPSVSTPKPSFRRFRCSAWLIQLRQRTALSPLKRSCFSRFAASEPRTVLPSLLH